MMLSYVMITRGQCYIRKT